MKFIHILRPILPLTLVSICWNPQQTLALEQLTPRPSNKVTISNGLINHGNTCYLNSQLQCFYHIPFIRNLILHPSDDDPCNDDDTFQSLQKVFSDMYHSSQPAMTRPLCRSLGINVYEQQDCQEFWKLLLPELELPILVDLYQGAFEDCIVAQDGSGRERRREEPFLDLSLEVGCGSVESSLKEMFTKAELLKESEGNGWRPSKDSPKVDALKGSVLRVQGLPSILQLHLKRFQYDWTKDVTSKLNSRFEFPRVLNLKSICAENDEGESINEKFFLYDLQSVVVHKGEYEGGHYYCYVRPDIMSDQWYRIDDQSVAEVESNDVRRDCFGGKTSSRQTKSFLDKLWEFVGYDDSTSNGNGGGEYGWGGKKSCAYMLQYVRRCELEMLYGECE